MQEIVLAPESTPTTEIETAIMLDSRVMLNDPPKTLVKAIGVIPWDFLGAFILSGTVVVLERIQVQRVLHNLQAQETVNLNRLEAGGLLHTDLCLKDEIPILDKSEKPELQLGIEESGCHKQKIYHQQPK